MSVICECFGISSSRALCCGEIIVVIAIVLGCRRESKVQLKTCSFRKTRKHSQMWLTLEIKKSLKMTVMKDLHNQPLINSETRKKTIEKHFFPICCHLEQNFFAKLFFSFSPIFSLIVLLLWYSYQHVSYLFSILPIVIVCLWRINSLKVYRQLLFLFTSLCSFIEVQSNVLFLLRKRERERQHSECYFMENHNNQTALSVPLTLKIQILF